MAKINISLVGGQPMPIYVGLEGTTPDSLVLVHSSQSENDARTIADIPSKYNTKRTKNGFTKNLFFFIYAFTDSHIK